MPAAAPTLTYDQLSEAVVGITCRSGRVEYFGTGTVIDPAGLILTSVTVVPEGASRILVYLRGGRMVPGRVKAWQEDTEFALLEIDRPEAWRSKQNAAPIPYVTMGRLGSRPRHAVSSIDPGFEVISLTERRRFIPLAEKFLYLDFVSQAPTDSPLRLSANLNKVSLSIRRFGYLLEDKNFRNALLVNRRRIRRTLLKNGDVLDLGDLTLLYRDNRGSAVARYSPVTPQDGKTVIKFNRVRGPIRRGTAFLTSEQYPNRVFYVTKNMVYIGRSEDNDLVVKARNVHYRHAKIERVGGRHKILDLGMTGNTFLNNRRIEQRYLKDGDMITIDKQRFKFGIATKMIRERPQHRESFQPQGEEETAPKESGEAPTA